MTRLSIYVPTWNRPQYLTRLLESIEPQLTDQVDVFVSINKSTEPYNLPDWVNTRTTRMNIGGDANIITGPTLVHGDYVWVIGDDDMLLPDAINLTLAALDTNPGLIIHGDGIFDMKLPAGTTYPNYTEFTRHVLGEGNIVLLCAHTLISSNTFLRSAYNTNLAIQKIDTRYGFHYGMLDNIFDKPVALLTQPTMKYDHQASIFQTSPEQIAEHMAAYPQVIYDIFDWISQRTGLEIPRAAWGTGFY